MTVPGAEAKICFVVRLSAHPGRRDDLLAGLAEIVECIADEEGTEVYAFHTDDDDPDAVWSYEVFADAAALAAHRANPAVAAFDDRLTPLLAGPPQVTRLRLAAAKGVSG
jgi:quinol monooxygenase YgiN